MRAVQCTLCSCGARCAVCSVRCAVCGVQCAVCSVQCAVCGVQFAVCSVCGVRVLADVPTCPNVLPCCRATVLLCCHAAVGTSAWCTAARVEPRSLAVGCLLERNLALSTL